MPSPALSTDQLAIVTYLSGVDASGEVAAVSYLDWNQNNPATYNASQGFAHKWDNNAAGPTIAPGGAAGKAGGTVTYAFSAGTTAVEQQALVADLALWSDEVNISFAPVASTTSADLLFTVTNSGGTSNASAPQAYSVAGSASVPSELTPTDGGGQDVITFDNDGSFGTLGSFTAVGGYAVGALTHEVGHMLGLGHSGPYNDGNGSAGSNLAPSLQENEFDSRQWSVMSYIQPSDTTAKYYPSYTVTGTNWTTASGYQATPETPMPLDIVAAQRLYGASTNGVLAGGQVFGFDCNVAGAAEPFFDFTQNVNPVVTLYDTGTGNTLDLSGYATASVVNLNPGTFSSAGALTNNIGIAFGTAIDAAVGGMGNDSFTVNGEADTITGGGGSDTVVFGGQRSSYVESGTPADLMVTNTATGITDTLNAISFLAFSDQTVRDQRPGMLLHGNGDHDAAGRDGGRGPCHRRPGHAGRGRRAAGALDRPARLCRAVRCPQPGASPDPPARRQPGRRLAAPRPAGVAGPRHAAGWGGWYRPGCW